MSLRFLKSHHSRGDRLPQVLLLSAIFHLTAFYLSFGDLFSIFAPRRIGSPEREFHLQLLSPSQAEEGRKSQREGNRKDFPVFPRDENANISKALDKALLLSDDIHLVELSPPALSIPKERKLPLQMTGPQDCMLKVVAMVCPDVDFKCIAEYKAFCATLPE